MKKQKKVLVMYLGERISVIGKVAQVFKDKRGEEHWFSGIHRVYFGDVYTMVDDRMSRKPVSVDSEWKPTDMDRLEYEAQKIVVRAHRQAKLTAMKMKKPHADITRAVALVRPFYWHLSTLDRRRFLEWFANACSTKEKK